MKRRLVLATLAAWVFVANAQGASFDHAAWDMLLKRSVMVLRSGQATQVDYAGMKTGHAELRRYLAGTSAISRAQFDAWSKADQLAFLINAYNARTVELILGAYPGIASIKELGSVFQSPWKKTTMTLLGQTRSLDDIEHKLIRGSGRYNDPRIHFAINCASIGCPALRNEAYQGEKLDGQLREAAERFLSDRSRNRLDGGQLLVSAIFKWYHEDFEGHAGSVGAFLAAYRAPLGLDGEQTRSLAAGQLPVAYLDYDWRLNEVPRGASKGTP